MWSSATQVYAGLVSCHFILRPSGLTVRMMFGRPAEAVFFKKRLTKEVYPELHKYLQEREFAVVAHNLQCTWEECIPALALKAPRAMSSTHASHTTPWPQWWTGHKINARAMCGVTQMR